MLLSFVELLFGRIGPEASSLVLVIVLALTVHWFCYWLTPVARCRICTPILMYSINVIGRYPQFGQQTNQGVYMQQDAEECWTQLIYVLSQGLKSSSINKQLSAPLVQELFGVELQNTLKCAESSEASSENETVFSLKCHISQEVNHLHDGLKHGLKGELEKTSPLLGRSALFIKESHIQKLPQYLTIQFVRFFWKRESNQKAKILRKVGYPLVLDVLDFCTEELKEKLVEPRKKLFAVEEVKAGLKRAETGRKGEGAAGFNCRRTNRK